MEKTYRATQKYLIESPRKLRLVAAMVKKMKPTEALEKLPFISKRASGDLAKVIGAAIANARVQGASDTTLVFKEIQIGEGPRLKRGRAASRGRWHPFKKRMSHIRVVLVSQVKEVAAPKVVKEEKAVKPEKAEKKVKAEKKGSK